MKDHPVIHVRPSDLNYWLNLIAQCHLTWTDIRVMAAALEPLLQDGSRGARQKRWDRDIQRRQAA